MDPYSDDLLCEHEDVAGAAGTPPVPPPNSVLDLVGQPQAWDPWRKIAGSPSGSIRIRLVSDRYRSINPFHSVNIPCNPDTPGSTRVQRAENVTVKLSASVGAKVKGWLDAKLGVDVSVAVTLTVDTTVMGERCRSIDVKFFYRYNLWEVEYVEPDTPGAGFTIMQIFVPIGWLVEKTYIPPTCCTARTAMYMRTLDGVLEGGDSSQQYALLGAAEALGFARALMVDPATHLEAFGEFARALERLAVVESEDDGVDKTVVGIRQLLDEMTAQTVKDALGEAALIGSVDVLLGRRLSDGLQAVRKDLGIARGTIASSPGSAGAAYQRAFAGALRSSDLVRRSLVRLDIEGLPDRRFTGGGKGDKGEKGGKGGKGGKPKRK